MAITKRKYRSGKVVWAYAFEAPDSTDKSRKQITGAGFETKRAAQEAEAGRRISVQAEFEASKRGSLAPIPKTLGELIESFCSDHAAKELAPKTVERYIQLGNYIAPDLLGMKAQDVTPLHLNREWARLRESGGRHRKTKNARPLSAKTVRNVASLISSVFSRAIFWGLCDSNPATNSEPPKKEHREGMALTPAQQQLVLDAAEAHWALPMILELAASTGARRGEVLALRWSDIRDGRAHVARSLSQTKAGLKFKTVKNKKPRVVSLPASTLLALQAHRVKQDLFREHAGPDYRRDMDLVIANPDGTPLRPDSVSGTVSSLCRRLKLPRGVSLHTLRHTHGSHLLASGMDLPTVSKRLGHSNVHVTAEVYAHAIEGRDTEAAERWERMQQRKESPIDTVNKGLDLTRSKVQ